MAWVVEACGFFEKERSGTLKPNDIYLFRVAQMLGDYAVHGAVLRRYNRSVDKLSARYPPLPHRPASVFVGGPDPQTARVRHQVAPGPDHQDGMWGGQPIGGRFAAIKFRR